MTKDEFAIERTRIISEMLDNPDDYGIYPTTKCFNELDALFDKITTDNSDYTKCTNEVFKYVTDNICDEDITKKEIRAILKKHFA